MSELPPPVAPPAAPVKQPTALWLAFGGCAALIVGAFLPWVSAATAFGSVSVNGIEGDGKLTAGAGAVAGVLLLVAMSDRSRRLCAAVVAVGVVAAAAATWDYTKVQDRVSDANAESSLIHASVGAGIYLTIAGKAEIAPAPTPEATGWSGGDS